MKHAFLIATFLWSLAASAQAPSVAWQKAIGGTGAENIISLLQTADSGYLLACTASSADGDVSGIHSLQNDYWIVKTTGTGSIVWQKCLGGTTTEFVSSIRPTADGGYILAGASTSTDGDVTGNHGQFDYWVVKMNATGAILWQKSLGGSGYDYGHFASQTSDGGYIVAGGTTSTDGDISANHGYSDAWIVRLNATGGIVWQKTFGGTGNDDASFIQQTPDGGFIVAGNTASNDGDVSGNHGSDDYWVFKLSASGTLLWQKTYGGSGSEDIAEETGMGPFQVTADGGYIIAGWSTSTDGDVTGNHGLNDCWVVKLSDTGRIEWEKSFGDTGDDEGIALDQTADHGYILASYSNSNDGDVSGNHGGFDMWITKVSDTGRLEWQKCLGGTGTPYGECPNVVRQTFDGGYIVGGYTKSNDGDVTGNHGNFDGWLVKLCDRPSNGPVTGPGSVCVGSSITLADTAGGGWWSTGNTNTTVTAGVVTGIAAGVSVISYTTGNACMSLVSAKTITVNPLPAPVVILTGTSLSTTMSYLTYQWSRNGTILPGATSSVYVITSPGVYSVTVTDSNGCSGTGSLRTGIGNVASTSAGIHIFPNPAEDHIAIEGAGNAAISVRNMCGQVVKESRAVEELGIADLGPGVYLISLYSEEGELLLQERLVKR